jgi:hypothetical protein
MQPRIQRHVHPLHHHHVILVPRVLAALAALPSTAAAFVRRHRVHGLIHVRRRGA